MADVVTLYPPLTPGATSAPASTEEQALDLTEPFPGRAGRWRPAQAGLLNVWRYADEILRFDRGRLLLRGPNGSGKSMALELLLPFLLDANSQPNRLTSALKSRGSLFDRFMAGQRDGNRAGFIWLQMERTDRPEVGFTFGARLSGSVATRKVDLTWFTTSQRIGPELSLLNEHRVPLTRAALIEAIGSRGTVHPTADGYRTAVRQTLYPGLSGAQYDAMILALLALRREKVSQDLTPQKLSDVLTAALPPVEEQELHRIAEGFEKLDRRRENLERLERDVAQVANLARAQHRYARSVLALVASGVRSAESERDQVTRRAREASEQLEQATARQGEIEQEAERGEVEQTRLEAEISGLRRSDAYRKGEGLESLRQSRDDGARQSSLAAARADTTAQQERRRESQAREADSRAATTATNLAQARTELASQAELVGATAVVATLDPNADPAESLGAWSRGRRRHINEVRSALRHHDQAVTKRQGAEERLESERGEQDQRLTTHRQAVDELDRTIEAQANALGTWLRSCRELDLSAADDQPDGGPDADARPAPPPPPDLVALARDPHEAQRRAERSAAALDYRLQGQRSEAQRPLSETEALMAGVEAERQRLVAGETAAPEAAAWRSPRGTVGLAPGAALWQLVEVRDGQEPALDGVEAALEASSLLDAWITVDGSVALAHDQAELFALAASSPAPDLGPTLADVLAPVADGPVPAVVVARVLAAVGLADSVAPSPAADPMVAVAGGSAAVPWSPGQPGGLPANLVGRDGTFVVGTLAGRGQVRPARYLGAAARERQRRRQLAEAEAELARLGRERQALLQRVAALDGQRRVLAAELAALPAGREVTAAATAADRAEQAVAEAERRVENAAEAKRQAEDAVRDRQRQLAQVADQHHLPTGEDALSQYQEEVHSFDRKAETFARRQSDHTRAESDLEKAQADLAEAVERLEEADKERDDLARRFHELDGEYSALLATVGADYAQITARITRAETRRSQLSERHRQLAGELRTLAEQVGSLRERLSSAEAARAAAEESRGLSHDRYRAAVSEGLVGDAGLEMAGELATVTDVLESARELSAQLPADADEQVAARAMSRVQEQAMLANQQLGGRVEVTFDPGTEWWWLLRATKDGTRRPVSDVAAALAQDLAAARAELDEEERRLFDETLTGRVRSAVAQRIRRANDLVDRVNRELATVKTAAAQVQVRLHWDVDPEQPAAVQEARRLLLRDQPVASDREALYAFFRARIEQAQADGDGTATWEDRLRTVLDYRQWHRFTFKVAHRDWDGFQPATSSRLQRLSTGERSMALHLPMLASIAAHYDYARGDDGGGEVVGSPRLVLLDELFAGVDVSNRGQLFALFVAWDFDAVLTSDHEWCAYSSLDGMAIHHLHADGTAEPVTTTRFVWTGSERLIEPA